MPEEKVKQAAPYLAFRTFLNALEQFNHGVPPMIDRSIWRTQPGGMQGLIMGALRFFNLIDDQNHPTQNLLRLVEKKEHRPNAIRALLEWSYPTIIAKDLTKMTAKMLEDSMEEYGVGGETKKKAVTFFLQAARYADLPLSPFLQSQIRATPTKRRSRPRRDDDIPDEIEAATTNNSASAANTKTVELKSGNAKITLSVTFDPFTLAESDRNFIFKLIDDLSGYGKSAAEKQGKSASAPQ